jgi:glycine/D-amino acid oxidase-like deaminating enzyme
MVAPTRTSALTSKHYSSWWDESAPDFAYQGQLPAYADVVIIGAGLAGIFTAYWLVRLNKKSRKSFKVIVLDEAPHPAYKASGRMGGAVYLGSNQTAARIIKQIGIDKAIDLYRYSGENNNLLFSLINNTIACNPEYNGGIRMATNPEDVAELDASHEFIQNKLNITSARFDHNKSQYIAIAPHTHGSLYVPFEGMLDPFALCNGLARLLRNGAGVSIIYGARIKTAQNDKNGPFIKLSNGHLIHAGAIVHTTTKTCSWPELSKHIVYKREHVVKTTPFGDDLDDVALPMMPIELGSSHDSIRLHNRSVIVTGGKGGMKKDVELGILDDSDYNRRVFDHLNADMLKHLPFTNLLELTHAWTYIETSTKDFLPMIGAVPTHQNHYVNVAHGRNKLGLSFLGAKNIAESILGMANSNEEYRIFSPSRFIRGENV